MKDKHPIHTTITTEAMRVLERYEKELGAKNTVLVDALLKYEDSHSGSTKVDFSQKFSWTKNKTLEPLLKEIPEGIITGIIGPPGSEMTLLMAAVIDSHQRGPHPKKQCMFILSGRKQINFIPATKELGMDMNKYIESHFLNIYEESALDKLHGIISNSSPKIVVIEAEMLLENGSSDIQSVFNSSGWKIISGEIRKKEIICFLVSRHAQIARYCDITIEFARPKDNPNLIIARIVENVISVAPSVLCKLAINGKVELVPILEVAAAKQEKAPLCENGSLDSLGVIVKQAFNSNRAPVLEKQKPQAREKEDERREDINEKIREIEKLGGKISPDVLSAIYGDKRASPVE